MDELSALPPEDALYKRHSKTRPTSLNSRYTGQIPPAEPVPSNVLDTEPSSSSVLHAPAPQRHLIDTSQSKHWLGKPQFSPTSSHGVSPLSPAPDLPPVPQSPSATSTSIRANRRPRRQSFGSLYNNEHQPQQHTGGLRQRQASNASIASTYTVHGGTSLHKTLLRSKHTQATLEAESASMGRRWIRWMHKRGLGSWVVPGAVAFATLVKLCIGIGSYSGESTPPMYGDYEAQRHWMEITTHLPFEQWYTYDLQYWGLDYPPLTAYVSWLCGFIGSYINPTWFALDTSRGIETAGSKLYMRLTVVFFDLVVYVPALIMFVKIWQGTRSKRTQEHALLLLLLQPALLLIDHGHFQYNSVMLGLTLLAVNFFATGNDLLGAVCFVLSLGFKQMALYYAPAVGSYLIAKCIYLGSKSGFTLFTRLAITTLLAFAILFSPFFMSSILDPITRIFPFSRGLFEDKVANFWCASNVVLKWRKIIGDEGLVRTSAALTAVGFLPSVAGLLRAGWTMSGRHVEGAVTPFLPLLTYALLNSSMSFFLFSFQVHEKTILLPLLPLTLVMSGAQPGTAVHAWGCLGNNVAVFSMWPLLKRDGMAMPYIALVVLWNRVVGYNPFTRLSLDFVQILSLAVYASAFALHAIELVIPAPARYPDLFAVLNVLICTPVFGLVWLWSIKSGVEVSWALGGLASFSGSSSSAPTNTTHAPAPPTNAAVGSNVDGASERESVSELTLGNLAKLDYSVRQSGAGGAPETTRRRMWRAGESVEGLGDS